MTFSKQQTDQLAAKLDAKSIKSRSQGGVNLSYIESWKAIDEANRIFGFDGWDSETIETDCVNQRERKIGKGDNQRDGWTVTYTAKVRVTAGGVFKDGSGAGHGIGVDLGDCHESALKEAESDARKRALMQYGNPFGLALYDKKKANVEDAHGRILATCNQAKANMIDVAGDAEKIATIMGDLDAAEIKGENPSWWTSLETVAAKCSGANSGPENKTDVPLSDTKPGHGENPDSVEHGRVLNMCKGISKQVADAGNLNALESVAMAVPKKEIEEFNSDWWAKLDKTINDRRKAIFQANVNENIGGPDGEENPFQ